MCIRVYTDKSVRMIQRIKHQRNQFLRNVRDERVVAPFDYLQQGLSGARRRQRRTYISMMQETRQALFAHKQRLGKERQNKRIKEIFFFLYIPLTLLLVSNDFQPADS